MQQTTGKHKERIGNASTSAQTDQKVITPLKASLLGLACEASTTNKHIRQFEPKDL